MWSFNFLPASGTESQLDGDIIMVEENIVIGNSGFRYLLEASNIFKKNAATEKQCKNSLD